MNSALTTKFIAYLRSENINYVLDDEGDIRFCLAGHNIYYLAKETDNILPYFVLIDFSVDIVKDHHKSYMTICNKITRNFKVLKAIINEDSRVFFSIESIIQKGSQNLNDLFEFYLRVIADAYSFFQQEKEALLNDQLGEEAYMGKGKDETVDAYDTLPHSLPNPEGMELEAYCQLLEEGKKGKKGRRKKGKEGKRE